MSVHDLVCQKVLNGVLVSEDAHDNVWTGLRYLHLKATIVRRPIKDVGINREYVGERCCLPHVMGVRCQLIVPSHLYESVLGFGQLRHVLASERRPEAESSSPFIRDSGGMADNSPA
jgi:hypothetical protein